MRINIKNSIKVYFGVICFFAFFITACKNDEVSKDILSKYDKADNYNYFNMRKVADIGNDFYVFMDNGLIGMTEKPQESKFYDAFETKIAEYYYVDYLTGEKTPLDMDELTGETNFDKRIVYLAESKRFITYLSYCDAIDIYDENWKHIKNVKLNFTEDGEYPIMIGMAGKNQIHVTLYKNGNTECYILDYDGNCIFKYDNLNIEFLGKNIVKRSNFEEGDKESSAIGLEKIGDNNTLTPLDGYDIYEDESFADHTWFGDEKYDFYGLCSNEDNVYLVGCTVDSAELIFNFKDYGYAGIDSGKSQYSIRGIYSKGNGDYIIITMDDAYRQQVLCFSASDKQTAEKEDIDKQEVVLLCDNMSDDLEMLVQSYNNQSTEYKVNIKDFAEYSNSEEKMILNLVGSDDIDGLVLTEFGDEAYINSGIFQDLNDYFDSSTKVKKEDFLDNVVESFTNEDGSIYQLYPLFYIDGYLGKNDANISDYFDYVSESDSEMPVIAGNIWNSILDYSGESFVCTNDKTINNDNLRKLLETAKEQQKKVPSDDNVDGYEMVQADKSRFVCTYMRKYSDYLGLSKTLGNLDYISMSSYETGTGIISPLNINISVLANSDNKEGMYDFLDYVFADETYNENFNNYEATPNVFIQGFTVLKSSWEDTIKYLNSDGEYIDRFGVSREFKGVAFDDNIPLQIDSDDILELDEFVKNVKYIKPMDEIIFYAICDEALVYFDDEQDIDKTMSNIEKKINDILRDY